MLHSAPVVLNRAQNSEYRSVGRFADAATANASATRNATFCPFATIPPTIAMTPTTTAVSRATRTSARGDRQDGGEGDRRDHTEQELAAEVVGQQRCGVVLVRRGHRPRRQQRRRA